MRCVCSTTIVDITVQLITGKIGKVQQVQQKVILDFLYAERNDSDKTMCKIEANTIRKMLVSSEFEYQGPSDMFDSDYEQSESDVQYGLKQDIKAAFE